MRGALPKALALESLALCLALGALAQEERVTKIKEGVLDSIELSVATVSPELPILIRPFSTEGVDLGTGVEGGKEARVDAARAMRAAAPELLQRTLESKLREGGKFQSVLEPGASALPEEHIVVEGRFLVIDPGSRAKRYWAGLGAGKSGVKVTGTVKHSSGKVLAEFTHMKHSGIGVGGGDYLKFLSDDARDVGADIGEFLNRWASGQDLHED